MSFVLGSEAKDVAATVAGGAPTRDALRQLLALTVAVVGAVEQLYRAIAREHPDQWDSLERSAETFTDEYVVRWLANADPDFKRAVMAQRRRKLVARAGALQLVESERDQRARWAAVTMPPDAPIPIAEDVGEGLARIIRDGSAP